MCLSLLPRGSNLGTSCLPVPMPVFIEPGDLKYLKTVGQLAHRTDGAEASGSVPRHGTGRGLGSFSFEGHRAQRKVEHPLVRTGACVVLSSTSKISQVLHDVFLFLPLQVLDVVPGQNLPWIMSSTAHPAEEMGGAILLLHQSRTHGGRVRKCCCRSCIMPKA